MGEKGEKSRLIIRPLLSDGAERGVQFRFFWPHFFIILGGKSR